MINMIFVDGIRDSAFCAMHPFISRTLGQKQYWEHFHGNTEFDKLSKRLIADKLIAKKELVRRGLRLVFV